MKYMRKMFAMSFGVALTSMSPATMASEYPVRSIELTVPYGAGGATDVIARRLASHMEKELGQSVVVVNRPGVQGVLQASQLIKAKPDGYTVGILAYTAVTYTSQLLRPPPFGMDDFSVIGGIGSFAYGMVVPANSPIKTVDDLIAAAKQPGGVSFAVTGAPNNTAFVKLAELTGGHFEQIIYKSGVEAVTAAAGGHVDVALQNPPDFAPLVKAGSVRLIASVTDERIKDFPDVPTMREQGYDVIVPSALGIAAPKGTPEPVRQRLEAAVLKSTQDPEYIRFMEDVQGMRSVPMNGAQFYEMLTTGYRDMGKLIQDLNVPPIN